MTARALPTVQFGDHQITRLISGGNPLCGNSHWSHELDAAMRSYFTAGQVVAYLHRLETCGYNAIQARGDYHRILYWLELFKREGGQLFWIGQTATEMADIYSNIRVIAAAGAIGLYHHGSETDNLWLDGRIDEVEDRLKCIRDCGIRVGLGTHIPEVIEYAEEKGWDVDFYMACFYNLNRKRRESALASSPGKSSGAASSDAEGPTNGEAFLDEDPARMCQTIRATDKMCLAFKILGAGRCCKTQDDVRRAFEFAFANIKPKDAVIVGMYPKDEDQIALNVEHTLAATAGD